MIIQKLDQTMVLYFPIYSGFVLESYFEDCPLVVDEIANSLIWERRNKISSISAN